MPDEAESLESLAQKLSDLDKEREQYIEWLRGRNYELGQRVTFTDAEGVAKQKRFVAVENELEVLRPRYMSRLLASLDASSKRLEETSKAQVSITTNLERSSDAQLKATTKLASIANTQSDTTKRLESSSDRLVFLTLFLILLTTITLTDTFESYFVSGNQLQLDRAILAFILLAIVVLIAVYWGASVIQQWRSAKKPRASEEG